MLLPIDCFHSTYADPMRTSVPSSDYGLVATGSHSEGRTGQFTFGSEVFPVTLLDLPCVVESYKTYDDSHLVKISDVGQVQAILAAIWLSTA